MRHPTRTVAVFTVVILVVIGILAALTIEGSYDATLSIERSKLAATAQVTSELIAQQLTSVEAVEQSTLGGDQFVTAFGTGDPARLDVARLQTILNKVEALLPEFQFAAVADARGTSWVTAPVDPFVTGKNFSYRDWYQGVIHTGRPYVSSAYVSAVRGLPLVVAVATPIRAAAASADAPRTGPVIGIMIIGYKVSGIQAVADRLATLQRIDLQLTDQAGVILARPGGISGHLIKAAAAPQVTAALAGRATTASAADGIAAGAPVAGLGWTVSAVTPLSATAARADRSAGLLTVVGLLLVLGLAGVALVTVTGRLEHAGARHAASAAELRTVQYALTDAIQVFGLDGTLLSRNPAAVQLFEGEVRGSTADLDAKWEVLGENGSVLGADRRPLQTTMRTRETLENVVVGVRKRAGTTIKWLSISTIPIRGPSSEVSGYVSCSRDISERVETARELRVLSRASEQLGSSLVPGQVVRALTAAAAELCSVPGQTSRRALLLMVDGPMLTISGEHSQGSLVSLNGICFAVTDEPHVQEVIATQRAVISPLHYEDFGPGVADLMRQAGIRNGALVPMTRNTSVFAVLAVGGCQESLVSALQVEHLQTLATVGALALRNAEAHVQVAELARTDPLTGVGNRRALDDRLEQLTRTPYALVAIDVNDLKKVNDTHGHDAGDHLLASLAPVLAAELRPSDIFARTGGDEFVALLVDCDALGAQELGRRLQRATATVQLPWGTPSICVGSAAGAAGASPLEVAKAADMALYAAKEEGKRPLAPWAAGAHA